MARVSGIEKMTLIELQALRAEVDRHIMERQAVQKATLRQQLAEMARAKGFALEEVLGVTRKRGAVPIKYRDPKNPENTWTGRGRTPRWMAAAMKGGRAKKEDFLI